MSESGQCGIQGPLGVVCPKYIAVPEIIHEMVFHLGYKGLIFTDHFFWPEFLGGYPIQIFLTAFNEKHGRFSRAVIENRARQDATCNVGFVAIKGKHILNKILFLTEIRPFEHGGNLNDKCLVICGL